MKDLRLAIYYLKLTSLFVLMERSYEFRGDDGGDSISENSTLLNFTQ